MAGRKRRARPSARKLRGKAMARGARHPAGTLGPLVSRKCAAGRHSECGECNCECHGKAP